MPDSGDAKVWQVGTLTYNRAQLGNVFFWLLWGDFCLTLMDNGVGGTLIPLQISQLGGSASTVGFLNGTVMALMSALFVSIISTTSDRHRGRLGRRMPFLLWATPPLALFLILMGFSPQLAGWLEHVAPPIAKGLSWFAATFLPGMHATGPAVHLVIGTMTILLILYKLCDLFPQSVYYYLWADVVPAKLMGTFACLFRVVAALGMFVFNRFLLGIADRHPEYVYIAAGLLYLLAFVCMVIFVKEGEYPPPEKSKGLGSVRAYLRESFTLGYYWKYYLMSACFIIAVKSFQQFLPLFGTETMGFSRETYGNLVSYKDIITIVPFLVLGPVVDKYHPLRAGLVAYFAVLVTGFLGFFLVKGQFSFAICVTAVFVSIAIYQAATGAIGPRLLPRDKYGQFCSANAVVWQLGWAFSSWACGRFLDIVGDYRYLFLWFAGFSIIGLLATISVYRDWKRLGGDENYQAPQCAG